jgi:HlyD family secretion protein
MSSVRKSRKGLYLVGAAALVLLGGAAGLVTLKGAAPDRDPARIAAVERGTMVKSVVATGKVEPITKIEIKSKANGIIKVLNADVDRAVKSGDILVELDREQLAAALRGAEANLLAARAKFKGG